MLAVVKVYSPEVSAHPGMGPMEISTTFQYLLFQSGLGVWFYHNLLEPVTPSHEDFVPTSTFEVLVQNCRTRRGPYCKPQNFVLFLNQY